MKTRGNISDLILDKIKEIAEKENISRVLAFKKGVFFYDPEPYLFNGNFDGFLYDSFSASNLSKILIEETKKDGKVLVLLKPCDSRSLDVLIKENRVKREKVYAVSVPCRGKIDISKLKEQTDEYIISVEEDDENIKAETLNGTFALDRKNVLFNKCLSCSDKSPKFCDEEIFPEYSENTCVLDKYKEVRDIENMTASQKRDFWESEFSKCERCYSCRNVCPVCSCQKCIFDNENSLFFGKSDNPSSPNGVYHIIRAYHVAGRCVDCGECERVCPEKIPLHLLNRKYMKDIEEFYGEGEFPLLTYDINDN